MAKNMSMKGNRKANLEKEIDFWHNINQMRMRVNEEKKRSFVYKQ